MRNIKSCTIASHTNKKPMSEQQTIEYKRGWHDDYLKWVCGFANAQGGVIFIGKDEKDAEDASDIHLQVEQRTVYP